MIRVDGKGIGRVEDNHFERKHYEITSTEEPKEGDMRIVRETRSSPQVFRIDWYGTKRSMKGEATGWFVAEGLGDKGYFPTEDLARECLAGPNIVAAYRRIEK